MLLLIQLCAQQPDSLEIFQGDTIKVVADRYDRLKMYHSITTKIPLGVMETPASIGLVSQSLIEEQNAISLSDALKNISGVNVQSGLGVQDFFLIRGFESTTSGLILRDGMHDPDNSVFNFYGFGTYDLYNINEIEVLKGPSSYLYGSNTLSGVVNLVYKKPLFKNFYHITANYGRYDHYRAGIDCGFSNNNNIAAVRLNAFWQNSGQYRPHSRTNKYAVNPALTWYIGRDDHVQFQFEYIDNRITPDVGIPLYIPEQKWEIPEISPLTSYQTPVDKVKQNTVRFRLDYRHNFDQEISLQNKTYLTELKGEVLPDTCPHSL